MFNILTQKLDQFIKGEIHLKDLQSWCSEKLTQLLINDDEDISTNNTWAIEIFYFFDELEDKKYNATFEEQIRIQSQYFYNLLLSKNLTIEQKEAFFDLIVHIFYIKNFISKIKKNTIGLKDFHKSLLNTDFSEKIKMSLMKLNIKELGELIEYLEKNEFEKNLKLLSI